MPFYEYECKSCGHTLEAMQKINDSPLRKCPNCGKSQLTRLMSAPVFRLKGGGWYETDFKGDQDHKKNLADRPETEAAKEEAKPAAEGKAADATAVDGKAGGDNAGDRKAAGDAVGDRKGSSADAGAKAASKTPEKADKSLTKTAADSPKKPVGGISKRGATAAPVKSRAKSPPAKPAKKPIKKAASKLKRRG